MISITLLCSDPQLLLTMAELVPLSNLPQPHALPPSPSPNGGFHNNRSKPFAPSPPPLPRTYSAATSPLPLSSLLRLPRGTSIPTLLPSLNLTSNLSINGIPITHTKLFVSGPHVIHGVATPFPAIAAINPMSLMKPNWAQAIRTLGWKGHISFALGLNAILDSLKESSSEQVTMFAPWDSGMEREAYMLKRVVK